MPRLGHGAVISLEELREARNALVGPTRDLRLGFAAVRPVDLQDFDFLFPDLQNDPANLLPESPQTVNNLSSTLIPGLHPFTLAHCGPASPCVRFAAAVADDDATLGTQGLARTSGAKFFPQLTEPSFARHTRDIMTADG